MKKILVSLVMLLMCTMVSAQEHMMFKGVPIDGTLQSFSDKLLNKGCEITHKGDDVVILSGDFMAQSALIYAYSSEFTKKIYMVAVRYNATESWNMLYSSYNKIVSAYREKYGKPIGEVKRYEYPYEEGDGHEMTALKMDKLKYMTKFGSENGEVVISIHKEGSVCIVYFDKLNQEAHDFLEKQATQDEI